MKTSNDFLHVGLAERGAGIGDHELTLKQSKADATGGQSFLPDLALKIECCHRRCGSQASEPFRLSMPGEFGGIFRVGLSLELLIHVTRLFFGVSEERTVFLDQARQHRQSGFAISHLDSLDLKGLA